jgi:hypothetical protein
LHSETTTARFTNMTFMIDIGSRCYFHDFPYLLFNS